MKNKRGLQVKQYRKEIADLLKSGKQDYARIRVEAVIRENLTLQAYEILELYMELLAVRVQLVAKNKEIPRDMIEALSSIIYSAQRVNDLPELGQLKTLFAGKYGKEYVTEASSDVHCAKWCVNENLRRCLTIEPPLPEEKLQTLSDIAQEFNVEWDMSASARSLLASEAARPPAQAAVPATSTSGTGQGGPGGQYASAADAAWAAAAAAQQAQAAAAYAAQFAGGNPYPAGGAPLAPHHGPEEPIGGKDKEHVPPSGPPVQPPGPPAYMGGGGMFGEPPYSGSTVPPTGPAAPGPFVVKSPEELQRAYDAAPGPPVKDHNNYGGQPTAPFPPPPPPQQQTYNYSGSTDSSAPTQPPPAAPPPAMPPPAVPPPQQSARAPSPPPPPASHSAQDEFDELQKRFEMLKKS